MSDFNPDAVKLEDAMATLKDDDTSMLPEEDKPEEKPEADPEAEPVDDADKAEETDPEAEPAEEEAPAVDPLQKQFDELGLGRQFRDPQDVLERARDANVYIDQLQKANDNQRAQLEALKIQQPTATPEELRDQFDNDPSAAMKQAGFAETTQVESLKTEVAALRQHQLRQEVAADVAVYPELQNVVPAIRLGRNPVPGTNAIWDEINREALLYPGIEQAGLAGVLKLFYPRAKARIDAKKRPAVDTVSDEKKAGANTTTPKPTRGKSTEKVDFDKMTSDEILAHYKKEGKVDF